MVRLVKRSKSFEYFRLRKGYVYEKGTLLRSYIMQKTSAFRRIVYVNVAVPITVAASNESAASALTYLLTVLAIFNCKYPD